MLIAAGVALCLPIMSESWGVKTNITQAQKNALISMENIDHFNDYMCEYISDNWKKYCAYDMDENDSDIILLKQLRCILEAAAESALDTCSKYAPEEAAQYLALKQMLTTSIDHMPEDAEQLSLRCDVTCEVVDWYTNLDGDCQMNQELRMTSINSYALVRCPSRIGVEWKKSSKSYCGA